MKRILLLISLLLTLTALPVQAEEGVVDKVERGIKKGGEATQSGIEKGAAAANKGVSKAFEVVDEKVFKPADGWIQNKVGNKGSAEKPADK